MAKVTFGWTVYGNNHVITFKVGIIYIEIDLYRNFIFFRDLDHSTTHRVESQSSVRVLNLVCVGDTWPRSKLCSWRIIAHCAAAGVYDCSFSRSLSKPHKISKYLPRKVYGNTSSIKTNSKYQFSVINDKCKAENHTG